MISKQFHQKVIFTLIISCALFTSAASAHEDLHVKEDLYAKAMKVIKKAHSQNKTEEEISDIYILWAGKARDQSQHPTARILFEEALQAYPDNARGHRLYGDYLMGYRGAKGGLYEQAAHHYFRAEELISEGRSRGNDEEFQLNRSIDILNRDGKDGIALHRSKDFSVFLTLSGGYERPSSDPLDLLAQELRVVNFKSVPGFSAAPLTGEAREDFVLSLPRRRETRRFSGELLLRFGDPRLPYVSVLAERSEIDEAVANPDVLPAFEPAVFAEGVFERTAITVGKNFILPREIDANVELGVDWRIADLTDPLNNVRNFEKEDTNTFSFETSFAKSIENKVIRLKIGGALQEIDNNGGDDDAANRQSVSLRYSVYPEPQKNIKANERFRGRLSTHWETGFERRERFYKGADPLLDGNGTISPDVIPANFDARERFYIPFFTFEQFGLWRGKLDLLFKYRYINRRFMQKNFASLEEGDFHVHEFTLTPTFVTVYKLYKKDFRKGLEHMTIAFPFTVLFGDGDFERTQLGLEVKQRWVFENFALEPSLGVDFAYYNTLRHSDWGVFFKVNLLSGHYYSNKN